MRPTRTVVQRLLPDAEVLAVDRLRSSSRTVVERIRLAAPGVGGCEQVVAKTFLQSSGFATEAGALSVLPAGLPTPRLLAEDPGERVLVMTDVGSGPSLADALLGGSAATADEGLRGWAEAMAGLHRATTQLRQPLRSAIVERGGHEAEVEPMNRWLAAVPETIAGSDAELAVRADLHGELSAMTAILDDPGWAALSQGDACPDNNVLTSAGLRLIDFEEAAFRHVAWDLAYLRVPWPSCWCAWDIPAPTARAATAHYCHALHLGPGTAGRARLDAAVEVATLAFALIAAAWFLPSALQRDDTLGLPELPAPSRRAAVLHRLTLAAETAPQLGYRETAAAARSWVHALERRWGPRALPTAPAFS